MTKRSGTACAAEEHAGRRQPGSGSRPEEIDAAEREMSGDNQGDRAVA